MQMHRSGGDVHAVLRHFPTLLARWNGGYARLWSYTVSHSLLVIRIERPGIYGNLHVCCCPIVIQAPAVWDRCAITISYEQGVGYVISDPNALVRITADLVEIKENVQPVNTGFSPSPFTTDHPVS